MDALRSLLHIYPEPADRLPLPTLYLPAGFVLTIIPFFISNDRGRISLTAVPLLPLALGRPFFTAGSPQVDYNTGGMFVGMLLQYLDFLMLSPTEGEEIAFVGDMRIQAKAVREADNQTLWQKLKWSLRLMITPNRGIGWSWQVKNVPPNRLAHVPRKEFVKQHLFRSTAAFVRMHLSLYAMGICLGLQANVLGSGTYIVTDVVTGWCGASWAWNGLNYIYSVAAVATAVIGICEQYQWPPITGSLSEAWSVRQMWSVSYHQLLRRTVQRPGIRLARLLSLRKGSLSSKYLQLYIAFATSCILHVNNSFHAVGREGGEIWFFMSQPVIITIEDSVQWCWRQVSDGKTDRPLSGYEKLIGWLWTFVWFSYSLPPFVKWLVSAEVVAGGWPDTVTVGLGREHAARLLASV